MYWVGESTIRLGDMRCGEGFCLVIPAGMPQPDGKILPYHAEGDFCELLQVTALSRAVQGLIARKREWWNIEKTIFLKTVAWQLLKLIGVLLY
jgi:hypothetical protein